MCCSRVWRVRTKPAAPVDVGRLAGDAARHAAQVAPRSRRRSRRTARRSRGGCRASGPRRRRRRRRSSPGAARIAERDRVVGADDDGRAVLGGGGRARSTSSTAPRKFGCWKITAEVSSSIAAAQAAASVAPPASGTSTTSMPYPWASVRSVSRLCGCTPRETTSPPLPVGELRQVGGGADRARALVDRRVGDGQAGQLADRGLVLEHHLQAALADLRLVGRVRGQELRAAEQHVDRRGHVVVVHPGSEERQLVLGARCCARARSQQVRVDLLLAHARGQVELAAQPHAVGDLVEELLDRRSRRSRRASARRSASVTAV